MATKPISKQIIDEFIEEMSKNKSLKKQHLVSLKELLVSGRFRKEDIVKVLKEEENHENS